jgi:voltage-gated potassium channel
MEAARPRDDSAVEAWLERATERLDPFMAWLGVVFALLVGYEIAVEVGPETAEWLRAAGWAIWAIFLTEYVVELWLAPKKLRHVRRRWFQALALLVPTLRVLRFLRLLRLGRAFPAARVVTSSYRSVGTARRLFRSRLGYLAATGVVVSIAAAELAYLFERDHPEGIFPGFGDALLWSFAAVLALQASPVPASVGGRLAMLGAFAFGLVVIASLAGTVGAYLVEERRERAAAAGEGD